MSAFVSAWHIRILSIANVEDSIQAMLGRVAVLVIFMIGVVSRPVLHGSSLAGGNGNQRFEPAHIIARMG